MGSASSYEQSNHLHPVVMEPAAQVSFPAATASDCEHELLPPLFNRMDSEADAGEEDNRTVKQIGRPEPFGVLIL